MTILIKLVIKNRVNRLIYPMWKVYAVETYAD
jgi:hypothetical protein